MAAVEKLSAQKVARLVESGRYGDGGGLWLQIRGKDNRSWIFRYKIGGKAHWCGLGDLATISLAKARKEARKCRQMILEGVDPIEARKAKRAAALAESAEQVPFKDAAERYITAHEKGGRNAKRAAALAESAEQVTFKDAAERYITAHEKGWRNAKHIKQWRSPLTRYAAPVIGKLAVSVIETGHVVSILEPLWGKKTETASRLRGHIEAVLNFAKMRGWCTSENPARWRGHLDQLLPKKSKVQKVEHFAALPWREVGAFMEVLAEEDGMGALALRFAILTAACSGEVRGATWGEIDMELALWTVPATRMKAGKEHRVPLSGPALAILREVEQLRDRASGDLVFSGAKEGKPLSDMSMTAVLRRMDRGDLTVHGFRSTFRDWCASATAWPREVAEAALAHTKGKVEGAYQREDFIEKRALMMAEWATFCGRPQQPDEVVPLH